ncbi:probable beta-1,4-xylosyltransferase IRX14 [Tanacetum coccineum]
MKFHLLHNTRRSKNSSPLDSSTDHANVNKSPANLFWIIFHCFCCLISLILGFRFSRLLFYLLLSTTNTPNSTFVGETLTFTTSLKNFNKTDLVVPASRVVVGRHGIRIRPWPHPDPNEVIKAHEILESVQREQKVMYGVKNARSLIVVTPTYVRTFQTLHLTGLMHTLMNVQYDIVWIVVEAGGVSNETEGLLAKAKGRLGLQVKHIGFQKKMPVFWSGRHELESEMRLHALRYGLLNCV